MMKHTTFKFSIAQNVSWFFQTLKYRTYFLRHVYQVKEVEAKSTINGRSIPTKFNNINFKALSVWDIYSLDKSSLKR